ncbi:hypothetical protein [Actinoplanes couchii]|uniref:Uncharacterized protein n=1 Tax=Actinoplanes couchii TaxID=403638 RepID=A0ABQ3XSK2_9ACTN|nr:hypothetical protein [Actinoplanes couchii]MDR6320083.1 hypothetical protein [Actinoplanes couchii]GID61445.1 hypothetical protein Aco03nite_098490 [Actinoplanes couchii]
MLDFDDLIGGAIGFVVWLFVVLLAFGILPFLLFPLEVAVLLVFVPGFYLLRMVGVTTWPVVVRNPAGEVVRVERHRWLHRALARRDALRKPKDQEMGWVTTLWSRGEAPCDGIYWPDDTGREFDTDGTKLTRVTFGGPIDVLRQARENPDDTMKVDHSTVELPDGRHLRYGEGPLGSDGMFALVEPDGTLVFVVALTDSNPFEKATVDGHKVYLSNNHRNSNNERNTLEIDLSDPRFYGPE